MANTINIALLGNTTTEYTGRALSEECSRYGLQAQIYNAPYMQYRQDILEPGSGLHAAAPELVILMLEGCELFPGWYEFRTLAAESGYKEKEISDIAADLLSLIGTIHTNNQNASIIINNFRVPYYSPLGILDSRMAPGLKQMISELNSRLEEYSASTNYLYVFNYDRFCANAGLCGPQDHKMYYLAKSVLTMPATQLLAHEYMRYILPLKGHGKKCLVLDLDNTLWGGVAGEDGLAGISLDLSGPGSSYYNFQKEILNLFDRGILLALCSKNNAEDALEILDKHPHMLLRKKHFACMKINWQDKTHNLLEISKELNVGLDSLVFFDDNPVEREAVKAALPQVTVVEVPKDPSRFCEALKSLVEFESLEITAEDLHRNEMYALNILQHEQLKAAGSRKEFLEGLQTQLTAGFANEFTIPRLAQLTQKTNQFNMTTRRYTAADIARMAADSSYCVLSCSVADRLGDSGIVGCCIVSVTEKTAYLDTFLLSCRVLGRDVEYAFLAAVADILRGKGISDIWAEYIPTEKNKANKDFYLKAGFREMAADIEAVTVKPGFTYFLPAENGITTPEHISILGLNK